MKSVMGMCFNWKALVGLGVLAVGIIAIAPGAGLAALPLLLLAACPISMALMMFGMRGGHGREHGITHEEGSRASLHERIEALSREQQRLERELRAQDDAAAARR